MTRPASTLRHAWMIVIALACAKPIDLPAPPDAAPVITGVSTRRGFYFDPLRIQGSGFDPAPDANTVIFPGDVVSRGSVDPATGELVTRVPYSTSLFEGPVQVMTRVGRSLPSKESFLYLGIGYPWVGSVLAEVPVRHTPAGIGMTPASAGGEPVFPSSALHLLVHGTSGKVRLPGVPLSFHASVDGTRYLVGYPARSPEGLSLISADGWTVLARAPASRFSERHVALEAGDPSP